MTTQGETPYWMKPPETKPVSQEMNEVFDRFREMAHFPSPETVVEVEPMDDGSTDESLDNLLTNVKAEPLGACCEGGKCQPKPETRIYQAKCEDAAHPQTTHFERLEALPMRPGLICEQAAKIVAGARNEHYGKSESNFHRISLLWEAYDTAVATMPEGHVSPEVQVAHKMILLKIARTIQTPDHTDSYRDGAGYFDCGAVVAGCDPSK